MYPERADLPIDPGIAATVSHLARYWREHPEACDTASGIARWWLELTPHPESLAQVEAALGWMSASGQVEALHAADGRVRYRRTAAAAGEDPHAKGDARADDPQLTTRAGMPRQEPPQDR